MLSQLVLIISFILFLGGNPGTSISAKYEEGLKAKEAGNVELALKIWEEAMSSTSDPDSIDPRIGIAYIETVAEEGASSKYEKASQAYFWSLSSSKTKEFEKLLFFELERVRPIMEGKTYRELHDLLKSGNSEFFKKLRAFWVSADVNPANEYNERLLEHFYRLAQLKDFGKTDWDFNTIYEKDHRARIFLKYGEPDYKREGRFLYNPLKIRNLLTQRISEFVDPANISDPGAQISQQIMNNIELRTQQLHNNSLFEVWVYYNESEYADRAVYMFESENGGIYFTQRRSIGDFIPNNAYSLGMRNQNFATSNLSASQIANIGGGSSDESDGTAGAVDFSNNFAGTNNITNLGNSITPAVLLQLMYYEQLSAVDDFFGLTYNRMESRFFDFGTDLSISLALENLNSNRGEVLRLQSEMPRELSEYEKKVNSIELNIYPYRFLNEYNKPVTLFFVRSNPFISMISDFRANKEDYDDMKDGDQGLQLEYRHYLQVYDDEWNLKYRLQSSPTMNAQIMSKNYKVGTLFSIPYQSDEQILISSELNSNQVRDRYFVNEEDFDPDLIAMGKSESKHLSPLSENEFDISDIVIGYNIKNDSQFQFPFIISHERELPVNENLVAYYEIYNTSLDPADFDSRVTIEYEIKTRRPRLIGAIFGKTKTNTTSKISKSSNNKIYRELIEIESEKLKPGNYILEVRVKDEITGSIASREVEFKVTR